LVVVRGELVDFVVGVGVVVRPLLLLLLAALARPAVPIRLILRLLSAVLLDAALDVLLLGLVVLLERLRGVIRDLAEERDVNSSASWMGEEGGERTWSAALS
jgi:hypothetical protein